MKNTLIWVSFLGIAFFMGGCAATPQFDERSEVRGELVPSPPMDKAIVLFIRSSGYASEEDFFIWDRDELLGISKAQSYFAYQCNPGEHLFIGMADNHAALKAELAGGKKYYIGITLGMGDWQSQFDFVPVTKDSQFWDQVEEWERNLNYVEYSQDAMEHYQAQYETQIEELLDFYEDAEQRMNLVHLSPEDGT